MGFSYQHLKENLVTWAEQQLDVYAIILVGSRARINIPADEHSDLDVIMYTTHPKDYAHQSEWLKNLGPFWCSHLDHTGLGEPEQFALYDGALKLDVLLTPIHPSANLQSCLDDSPHHVVLARGFEVLLDKTSSECDVNLPNLPDPITIPNQAGFDSEISETAFLTTKITRFLERGDQFRAHGLLMGSLRRRLLIMLEWEAQSRIGIKDIWYDGRFISEWGDPETIQLLPEILGVYEIEDQKNAIKTFILVYLKLAQKVGTAFNLEVPQHKITPIVNWITDHLV